MSALKKRVIIAIWFTIQPLLATAESSFDFTRIFESLMAQLRELTLQSTLLGHTLDNSTKQLETLHQQKQMLEDTQKLMQGHYDYGSKHDDPRLTLWQHTGKDWQSFLNSHQSGDSDPLTALAREIEKEFPIVESSHLYSSSKNPEQAKLFDLLSQATLASRASHTLSYNNIDTELRMLERLQAEIEKSPNQKASLDLIARIQIEQAKLIAYQIKSNAVNANLTSLQAQQEVSDAKWASEFFKWH